MLNFLKQPFLFLWKKRKLIFFIFFLSLLFFSLRFPWNLFLEQVVREMELRLPPKIQTSFDKAQAGVFPPGLKLKNLSVYYQNKSITMDSFEISPAVWQWLAFKKAFRVKAFSEGSGVFVEFRTAQKTPADSENSSPLQFWFVKGSSPSFNLDVLSQVFPHIKAEGKVYGRFNFEGSLEDTKNSEGLVRLRASGVQIARTLIPTPFGPLSLPPVQWKEGEVTLKLKDGELLFQKLKLGAPSDDFIIQMKGSAALASSYGRLRLDSYDAQLQMDIVKGVKISLLDLIFPGFKQDKGKSFRYGVRLTGRGDQIPDMEKFSGF